MRLEGVGTSNSKVYQVLGMRWRGGHLPLICCKHRYPYARKTPEKVCGRNGGPVMTDSDFQKLLHILDSARSLKSARDIDTFGDILSNGHLNLPESGGSHGFQSGSLGG